MERASRFLAFSPFFVCEAGNGSKGTSNRKSIRLPRVNETLCHAVGFAPIWFYPSV
nr:MAG TPA: hypothetical protein [Caudoviricetes sp.]